MPLELRLRAPVVFHAILARLGKRVVDRDAVQLEVRRVVARQGVRCRGDEDLALLWAGMVVCALALRKPEDATEND